MKSSEKVNKLDSVWHWGDHYLKQADIVMKETDAKVLTDFRDELWDFITSLGSRWVKRGLFVRRMRPDNRRRLQTLYDELRKRELDLAKRILEVQKSQEILERMERIAFPKTVEGIPERTFSEWNAWPIRYSAKTFSKLAAAKIPE